MVKVGVAIMRGRGSERVRAPQQLVPRRPPSRPARHIVLSAGGAAAGDG